MAKTKFFDYLSFALQFAPAGPEEKEVRMKLASISVGPGVEVPLYGEGLVAWRNG